MTTYADPTRCPDCHAVLPHDPQVCPACALPLTGGTAVSLFATFQEVDRLLAVLRSQKSVVPAVVPAPSSVAGPGSMLGGVAPYPAPDRAHPSTTPGPTRLSGVSVPKILLSLGALCLLVAAVIFLAVAWSWLGVGGRTVVLVALTGTALGLSVALHRRGLRMAAESLAIVGLGLLALDVVGLDHAGWLGRLDSGHLTLLTGSVVATGALIMLVATARRPLTAAALVAPFAVLVGGIGAQADAHLLAPLVMTVAILLGLARLGVVLPSTPLQVGSLVAAGLGWAGLVLSTTAELDSPVTVATYVGHLDGWPFLAATLLAALVGPVTGMRHPVSEAGYAVAGLVGSYAVLAPVLDNEPTAMTFAVLAGSVLWVGALLVVPPAWRPVTLLPLAGTLVVPAVAALDLSARSVSAALSVGALFSQPFDARIASKGTEVAPLLLLPTLITIAAAGCAAARLVAPVRRVTWGIALGPAVVLGSLLTLPLYDAPLALLVGIVLLIGVGGFAVAERLPEPRAGVARIGVLAVTTGATLLALPSDRLASCVLATACVMAARLMPRTDTTGDLAAFCFPIAFAAMVWSGANVIGIGEELRALPALLVLGVLVILRPRLDLEVSSALVAVLASAVAVLSAADASLWLAVHLTVAGALVTATSIVNPSRRTLAWPGGLLLALATWVRLYDLGVHLPEAYTLPSALALIAVGAWRMRRDDTSATLTVLGPGLALATVPSLVATLDDPASLRALLLGLACLGLTVAGAGLRWGAPLVVGASVGALLALRELAPYAAVVPSWLTIGLSGAILLVVGITWESRMHDMRRAARYVAALR